MYHVLKQTVIDMMAWILCPTGAESLSTSVVGRFQHPIGPGIVSLELKRVECEADYIRLIGKLKVHGALRYGTCAQTQFVFRP